MIGKKTTFIIGLLILLYGLALITQRHFYPIVAFNMFAEIHPEPDGVIYTPYVVIKSGELLVHEKFNPWPIRRTDIHKTIENWIQQKNAETQLAALSPVLLNLMQQYHTHSKSPEHQYKCYGILQLRWPLSIPPALRAPAMESKKLTESCNEE